MSVADHLPQVKALSPSQVYEDSRLTALPAPPLPTLLRRFWGHLAPGGTLTYLADNPAKDFCAPRQLGWETVRFRMPGRLQEHATAQELGHAPALELCGVHELASWVALLEGRVKCI